MSTQIDNILRDEWYKNATKEEMRAALMHIEQGAIDRLRNHLGEQARVVRDQVFEECAEYCNWK